MRSRGRCNEAIQYFLRSAPFCGLLLSMISVVCAAGSAQGPTSSVRFEVVSIKPSGTDCVLEMIGPSQDGFHLHCLNFKQMVQYAYGLNLFEEKNVLGIPAWAGNKHFDLDAPVPVVDRARFEALPPTEKAGLLRAPLAERFALRTHEEQRDMPVYALIQGKPPLKIKPTNPAADVANKPTLRWVGRSRIDAYHCTMEDFRLFISPLRGRPVVDHTKLSGKFDFSLTFTPETSSDDASEGDAAPSIFTALQEQLGLRLIPGEAAQRVVVVDGVSQPTPN